MLSIYIGIKLDQLSRAGGDPDEGDFLLWDAGSNILLWDAGDNKLQYQE